MRILKRPMFSKGGSTNDGIMDGLNRRGYAESNIADIFKSIGSSRGVYSDIPLEDIPEYEGPERFQWPEWMKPQKHKITTSSGEEIWTKGGIPIDKQETVPPEAITGYETPIPEVKSIKDDGDIDNLSNADVKTILANKKSVLSDRAKEFAKLLSPGAQKRAVYDALGAASTALGESTGDTKQDIANAITAAAGRMGTSKDIYDKANLLAIEEDIKKGIAEASYKPNSTEALINFYRGVKDKDGKRKYSETAIAGILTSKKDENLDITDFLRATTTAKQGHIEHARWEQRDNSNFGGILPENRKGEIDIEEAKKTMVEGKVYFDQSKRMYVEKVMKDGVVKIIPAAS